MRRLVFAMVLTTVLGFATLANAYPVELLTNGGFETGAFSPWQPGSLGASDTVQSSVVNTGTMRPSYPARVTHYRIGRLSIMLGLAKPSTSPYPRVHPYPFRTLSLQTISCQEKWVISKFL